MGIHAYIHNLNNLVRVNTKHLLFRLSGVFDFRLLFIAKIFRSLTHDVRKLFNRQLTENVGHQRTTEFNRSIDLVENRGR